jgi:predicted RNase H-like nuclease (RuvC/YqgF family)
MPICPGCERSISYDELVIHEQHCDGISGSSKDRSQTAERLDRRLSDVEARLEERLRELEQVERRMQRLERTWRTQRAGHGD